MSTATEIVYAGKNAVGVYEAWTEEEGHFVGLGDCYAPTIEEVRQRLVKRYRGWDVDTPRRTQDTDPGIEHWQFVMTRKLPPFVVRGCPTCKWSRWERTPSGRIKKKEPGECVFPPIPMPVLPSSCRQDEIRTTLDHRGGIWLDDGSNCPCWEYSAIKSTRKVSHERHHTKRV